MLEDRGKGWEIFTSYRSLFSLACPCFSCDLLCSRIVWPEPLILFQANNTPNSYGHRVFWLIVWVRMQTGKGIRCSKGPVRLKSGALRFFCQNLTQMLFTVAFHFDIIHETKRAAVGPEANFCSQCPTCVKQCHYRLVVEESDSSIRRFLCVDCKHLLLLERPDFCPDI